MKKWVSASEEILPANRLEIYLLLRNEASHVAQIQEMPHKFGMTIFRLGAAEPFPAQAPFSLPASWIFEAKENDPLSGEKGGRRDR